MKSIFICLLFFPVILSAQKKSDYKIPNYNSNIYCFDITPNEELLYYYAGNQIVSYSLKDKEVRKVFDFYIDSPVISILARPSNDLILLGTKSGKLYAVKLRSGELLREIDHKTGGVKALTMTSDGDFLLCACENGVVYKHPIGDIDQFTTLYEHNGTITSVDVSPEKKLIAISCGDATITLFQEQTLEQVYSQKVGEEWIRRVVFNDNTGRLLSVGDDGKLREWNITTTEKLQLVDESQVSKNWILCLDIGEDGKAECWGGMDHKLKVRFHYGIYSRKLKGPLLNAKFISQSNSEIGIVCCVLGTGILVTSSKEMKFKSYYE